jgi:hypothetical protein
MGGSYTADEQAAAVLAGGIADGPTKLTAGTVTASSTTAATTSAVTHGLGSTPDFVLGTIDNGDAKSLAWAANTTTLTFTFTSSTSALISYIAGYTA